MAFDAFRSSAAHTDFSVTPEGASIGGVEAPAISGISSAESAITATSASPTLETTITSIITITTGIASKTPVSQGTTSSSNVIATSFARVTLASTLLVMLWSAFHLI